MKCITIEQLRFTYAGFFGSCGRPEIRIISAIDADENRTKYFTLNNLLFSYYGIQNLPVSKIFIEDSTLYAVVDLPPALIAAMAEEQL